MRRDHSPIEVVDLRNTNDPRNDDQRTAWTKLEERIAAARKWLESLPPRPDIAFGSSAP